MKRSIATALVCVLLAGCSASNEGGGGGGGGSSNPWYGDYTADRMEWNYTCDNGNKGGAFNENITALHIEAGESTGLVNITQTDLSDPQTWECQVSGSTATVVAVLDSTNAASDFGVHSSSASNVSFTGQFVRSSSGSISTTWDVEYQQNGARCTETITGTFSPGTGDFDNGGGGGGFDDGGDDF